MGKYGEALGEWHLEVGGADIKLTPQQGDNVRFREMMMESKKTKDEGKFLTQFTEYILGLIRRDNQPIDEEEKKEQAMYVEFNLLELLDETLVKFRWTTRERLEKDKELVLKNELSVPRS